MKINIFWFRRDLRPDDNTGLSKALSSGLPVLPVFIFDTDITEDFPADDPRISFIYDSLASVNNILLKYGSSLLIIQGSVTEVWTRLVATYEISKVFVNRDYEPHALSRDKAVKKLLEENGIGFISCKDQVIFEEKEIVTGENKPYTIFTPYKKKWLNEFYRPRETSLSSVTMLNENYLKTTFPFPSLKELGFTRSSISIKPYDLSRIDEYDRFRDIPAADATTYLGPHLRFGTISIRQVAGIASIKNEVFLSELVWREFFMQILFNFPHVVTESFRRKYDDIVWRNNEKEFKRWCNGETGYPLVDAGMRQLNETGYMHNRIRMVTASFLCKHLLIDWRWGEAYFAGKLNDHELSSNNGNWQWSAGTGCDAAPYFRIFNPLAQQKKFDPENRYISRWLTATERNSEPIVEHSAARLRALSAYSAALRK